MKRPHLFAACAFALSILAGTAEASNRCTMPDNVSALVNEIAAGVNANRRANGQAPLAYNRQLAEAATAHACDMSVNGFFGHNSSNGANVGARVQRAGYRHCLVAENLAWGYPSSQQIISGWMNSPGHRSNMLHPRAQEFGVAVTNGAKGPNWVLVLAKGC